MCIALDIKLIKYYYILILSVTYIYLISHSIGSPKGNALTRIIELIKHPITTQYFDPLMVNQTTATDQFTTTSSAMVNINQANIHFALEQQTSGISEINQSEINDPNIVIDDKVARKRQRDREYRERCKVKYFP